MTTRPDVIRARERRANLTVREARASTRSDFNHHEYCWHCSICGGQCTLCDGDGKIARSAFDEDTRRWYPVDLLCPIDQP